jgi:hypothetical protein
MTVAAVAVRDLPRHALVEPGCDCGSCAPTWARRRGKSRRFSEPVTLLMAVEAEPARRLEMVREHRDCLAQMVAAVDELLALSRVDDPARPGVGLALVMFGGELASALRADQIVVEPLPEALRLLCAETVSAAMSSAAGCLAALGEVVELVAAMSSLLDSVR